MPPAAGPQLPTEDVAVNWTMSTQRFASSAQDSRAENVSSASLTLIHRPTGCTLSGNVPAGRYTKKQMQAKKQELQSTLFAELSQLVAKQR